MKLIDKSSKQDKMKMIFAIMSPAAKDKRRNIIIAIYNIGRFSILIIGKIYIGK